MWHTVFIVLHAVAGSMAWLTGLLALPAGRFFPIFRWSSVATVAALVPALALGWRGYPAPVQVAYSALLVLGVVMAARAVLAGRVLPEVTGGPTVRYVEHVGFTVISLSDAFAVVTMLRAGAPPWLVVAVAISVAVLGHVGLRTARARLVHRRDPVPV